MATSLGNTSLRFLSKGPEYFRSSSLNSQASDARRPSAAERLEADKLKYVKSARVRRRKAGNECQASLTSHNLGSTGSSGRGSTDSPLEDDDDVVELTSAGNDVTSGRAEDHPSSSSCRFRRSATDADLASSKVRPNQSKRRPRPRSSTVHGIVFTSQDQSHHQTSRRINNSADEDSFNNDKSLHSKEGQDNLQEKVCSHPDTSPAVNHCERRSRSDCPYPSTNARSSSLGPATPRHKGNALQHCSPVSDSTVMSPRSQLRKARNNLKKVISPRLDENQKSSTRRCLLTPRAEANNFRSEARSGAEGNVRLRHNTSNRGALRARPFSVIENINRFELAATLNSEQENVNPKPASNSPRENEINVPGNNDISSASIPSSRHLKRRSLDISHAMERNLQLNFSASFSPASSTPIPNPAPNESSNNIGTRPKPWSRTTCDSQYNPTSSCESKKNIKGPKTKHNDSRKSLSEAIGKIINSSDREDDMDTAYSSMSPDVSTDSKTQSDKRKSSMNITINDALNGRAVDVSATELKNSNYSIETNRGDPNAINSTPQNSSSFSKSPFSSTEQSKSSRNNFVKSVNYPKKTANADPCTIRKCSQNREWVNNPNPTTSSQPLNRIDLAPGYNQMNCTPFHSPMLAPRSRKEITPEYTINGNSAPVSQTCFDNRNHPISSSQPIVCSLSVENNNPAIGFHSTNFDSGRGRKGSDSHSTPLKTTSFHASLNKSSPKRHNNGSLSPTASPNKQVVRSGAPLSARSASSTPYSSLKRAPTSSRSSSLRRNRQRSKSDVSSFHNELDRFFSTMGMDESIFSFLPPHEVPGVHVSSESDFSFAGASAYVREGPDDPMDIDPIIPTLTNVPAVSVIEKNARVMRWIMSCKKSMVTSNPKSQSSRHGLAPPAIPPRPSSYNLSNHNYPNYAPLIPPRSFRKMATMPVESDV